MRALLFSIVVILSASWTSPQLLVHGQIVVGCFQGQPDSSTGANLKSFQDIFMSQGACTTFCKSSNSAYALTTDGSTCHCSNSPPLDSNKVDDSKCDKPCMGYPFEMCGGTAHGLANVLLIGSSVQVPSSSSSSSGGGSSSNIPSPTGQFDSETTGSKNISGTVQGGKNLNANNSPGMFPPPPLPPQTDLTPPPSATGPIPTINREIKEKKDKKGGQNVASSDPSVEDNSGSGNTSVGAAAAGTVAAICCIAFFGVAIMYSRRRRARLAQAAWTENMLLPSSLVHTSNDDELEGHDYTRATPIYNNIQHPSNMHFLPPPILHPRQTGPLHMQQPSFPPPMADPHYGMRGPFQPFPMHPMQYEHLNLNHKEPLISEPSAYSRGPQTLQERSPFEDDEQDSAERMIISRPSVRSVRSSRREREQSGCMDLDMGGGFIVPHEDQ